MSWKPPSQQHFNGFQANPNRPSTTIPYQNYYNGNAGPNFQSPKPANLSNSNIRQFRNENGTTRPKKKEVIWPPPPDDYEMIDIGYHEPETPHHTLLIKKQTKPFDPPPQYIPLRETVPLVETATPVYKSQPVAEPFHGGAKSADQKWPPAEYKTHVGFENQARVNLTHAPEFRPRKAGRDYTTFFARNALPNTYSGYKPPPGTQHHDEPYY